MNEASVEVCHKKHVQSVTLHSVSPGRFAPEEVVVDGSGRLSRNDSASVGCLNNFLPPLCGYVMAKRIPCSRSRFFTFPKACLFLTMAAEKSSKIDMLWRL